MPVPQTLTVGALGLLTKWSPISKHSLPLNVGLLVNVELGLPKSSRAAEQ